jgi:hypothetical protein
MVWKSKPNCFAPQALIGSAFSFRATASVPREAEVGYGTISTLESRLLAGRACYNPVIG